MKIVTFLLLVFFYKPATAEITLSVHNAPLDSIFREIQLQSDYTFVYTSEQLEGTHRVSFAVKRASLDEVLAICFKDQPLLYAIEDKFIIVRKKVFRGSVITGRVVNENDEPLAGATVTAKKMNRIVQTDANGDFTLSDVADKTILIISNVGYETKEIVAEKNIKIIIRLGMAVSKLDEVKVIAYGTTTERMSTGDVGTLKAETIAEEPVANPLAALEGRVSGVNIVQNTGVPGGGFTVQIRGQNSLRSAAIGQMEGNDPLYIVDGVPFPSTSLSQNYGAAGKLNPLNNIDPQDIESIDVLKDADATSIYGSRGSNGVILITTKKGKAGKTKVDLNAYSGAGVITRKLSMLNTPEYLRMRHEAFNNDGASPDPGVDYDLLVWDTTKYTDWQKIAIGGTAKITDLQGSVSGGNTGTQFLVGGGYHRESTVFPGDFADKRASVHLDVNHISENQKFRLSMTVSYVNDMSDLPPSDLTTVDNLPPDAPSVFDSSGKLNWANGTFSNPFAYLFEPSNANTNTILGNGVISYQLLPGLELKTSLGYTKMDMNEEQLFPLSSLDPAYGNTSGYTFVGNNNIKTWIAEPQALYKKKIGKGQLDLLLGGTFQDNTGQSQSVYYYGFSNDNLLTNIAAASKVYVLSSNYTDYRYAAAFGRITYNYQEKYLLNFTGRRDGSSRFGPGKQFADFGAAGLGWIFSKESFIQKALPFVSFGKLRASYGTSGSDQIGDYQYLSTYAPTSYIYNGITGLLPARLYNPNYAWEINKKMEFGLDAGLSKDRILFTVSYYRNRSSNQLVGIPLPEITGFTSIESNFPAMVQNTGWEFSVNTITIKTSEFSWTMNLTLTIPHNKLVSFPDIAATSYNGVYTVGQPLNIFKGFRFAGVDPQTGVYQFLDSKGNITSSPQYPDDYVYTQKVGANYYGGFQNSFRYKHWQLDIFVQFVNQTGNDNNLFSTLPGTPYNQPSIVLERWQKPGNITGIQKFNQDYSLYGQWSDAVSSSNQQLTNASFIRVKNLSFSYELPDQLKQKMGVRNFRVYLRGQNLFTITKYTGLDPETQGVLPLIKTFTAGLQITL